MKIFVYAPCFLTCQQPSQLHDSACELPIVDARKIMLHAHVTVYMDKMYTVAKTISNSKQCHYCIFWLWILLTGRK